MKITSHRTYTAPPEAVFAALTSPEVLTEKYAALGHRDIQIVEHREHAGAVRVRSKRGVPMDVPGFAKRFLKPVNAVDQTDDWRAPSPVGERRGTWKVSAAGVPVSTGGTLHLNPTPDGGTTVEITAEVTCSIPLIGGKLSSFVGGDIARAIHAEEDFNDRYLALNAGRPRRARATKDREVGWST